MPSLELNKSIEARRVNKRSKLLLNDPPATIPFGALVQDIEEDGENARFTYLGELFQCTHNLLRGALGKADSGSGFSPSHPAAIPADVQVRWEELRSEPHRMWRAKVPGGWFVTVGTGATFCPDPEHSWDGRTLD